MIIGVGIDLVDTEDFERRLKRTPNLAKTILRLTSIESQSSYSIKSSCYDERNMQLATSNLAIFEAFLKACPDSLKKDYSKIRVQRNSQGKPELVFADSVSVDISRWRFHSSLSHHSKTTIAVVVIEESSGPAKSRN